LVAVSTGKKREKGGGGKHVSGRAMRSDKKGAEKTHPGKINIIRLREAKSRRGLGAQCE